MISVAMATYNGAKYLPEQMDSILNQTISDIEIIVCDDCSTDKTWEILQSYAANDPRIHCYRNDSNLGFKKNFEKAISLCQGELIALSDQDDIWEKNHLEVLQNLIGNYDIACGNAELIDKYGNDLNKTLSEADYFYKKAKKHQDYIYRILFNSSCFQGASMLIKRKFLNCAIPIPDKVQYHDTWFALLACFNKGLLYSHQIITQHRRHENNASQRTNWHHLFNRIYFKRNIRRGRDLMIPAIQNRLKDTLTNDQKEILKFIEQYKINRKSFLGKIKNCLFRLRHHSKIYTTSNKVFLEW